MATADRNGIAKGFDPYGKHQHSGAGHKVRSGSGIAAPQRQLRARSRHPIGALSSDQAPAVDGSSSTLHRAGWGMTAASPETGQLEPPAPLPRRQPTIWQQRDQVAPLEVIRDIPSRALRRACSSFRKLDNGVLRPRRDPPAGHKLRAGVHRVWLSDGRRRVQSARRRTKPADLRRRTCSFPPATQRSRRGSRRPIALQISISSANVRASLTSAPTSLALRPARRKPFACNSPSNSARQLSGTAKTNKLRARVTAT